MNGGELSAMPKNPNFADDVKANFARQGMLTLIGAELVDVAPGCVAIELPHSPHVTQQKGFFHGGAIGMIADAAGGYAALTLIEQGNDVLTVSYTINFLRPAEGQRLRAVGEVVRAGTSVTVAKVEVFCIADGVAKPCAVLQETLMRVPPPQA